MQSFIKTSQCLLKLSIEQQKVRKDRQTVFRNSTRLVIVVIYAYITPYLFRLVLQPLGEPNYYTLVTCCYKRFKIIGLFKVVCEFRKTLSSMNLCSWSTSSDLTLYFSSNCYFHVGTWKGQWKQVSLNFLFPTKVKNNSNYNNISFNIFSQFHEKKKSVNRELCAVEMSIYALPSAFLQ